MNEESNCDRRCEHQESQEKDAEESGGKRDPVPRLSRCVLQACENRSGASIVCTVHSNRDGNRGQAGAGIARDKRVDAFSLE